MYRPRCVGRDHSRCFIYFSEQGHLFCKECILKYLLTKKKEYEEQLQAYEEQMQELQV